MENGRREELAKRLKEERELGYPTFKKLVIEKLVNDYGMSKQLASHLVLETDIGIEIEESVLYAEPTEPEYWAKKISSLRKNKESVSTIKKIKKYGLMVKDSGELLGFSMEGQEVEFGTDVKVELSDYADKVWLVDTKEEAERAKNTKSEWYSADYYTPDISVNRNNLEVVEVELTIKKI